MMGWLLVAQAGGGLFFWGMGRVHPEASRLTEDLKARSVAYDEVLMGSTWMVALFFGHAFTAFHWIGGERHFEGGTGGASVRLATPAWNFWVGGYQEFSPYVSLAGGVGLGKVYPRIVVYGATPERYEDLFTGGALNWVESPRMFAMLEGVLFLWAPAGTDYPPFAGVALAGGYVYDFRDPPWRNLTGGEVQGVPGLRFRGWFIQAGVVVRTFPQR